MPHRLRKADRAGLKGTPSGTGCRERPQVENDTGVKRRRAAFVATLVKVLGCVFALSTMNSSVTSPGQVMRGSLLAGRCWVMVALEAGPAEGSVKPMCLM